MQTLLVGMERNLLKISSMSPLLGGISAISDILSIEHEFYKVRGDEFTMKREWLNKKYVINVIARVRSMEENPSKWRLLARIFHLFACFKSCLLISKATIPKAMLLLRLSTQLTRGI